MKWGRQYDYHGSRSYEANEPVIGRPSLMLHWVANVMHERWRKLTGRSSPAAFTVFNFSLLGDDKNDQITARLASPPTAANVPGRPAANLNVRDWRVFP